MRKKEISDEVQYKIILIDDEDGLIDSLSSRLRRMGYYCIGITNPMEAIELVKKESFDLMILDFLMEPIHGDRVVELLREFNKDIYVLLLTGYKDIAPGLDTIKALDIQGYCEKSDKFEQLLILIESAIKVVKQRSVINMFDKYNEIFERYLSVCTGKYDSEKTYHNLKECCSFCEICKWELIGMLELLEKIGEITNEEREKQFERILDTFSTQSLFNAYMEKGEIMVYQQMK